MKQKKTIICIFLLLAFLLGKAHSESYPKIDITGYKKWEYRSADVKPKANYYLGLSHLGGYYPTVTGGPWQERLQLQIMALLTEKLKVSYDIEQQPESPDKYDVKVSYDDKHVLSFGDITATFSGNEFASATKFLNGVMVTSRDTDYELVAVPSAKLKSQIQGYTTQIGNNTKGPYSLGHVSILEGSEQLDLNKIPLVRGQDYIIDYFEGKVTFNRVISDQDTFGYSYEYTNVIDLFFPALSKKDFLGIMARKTFDPSTFGQKQIEPTPVFETYEEVFPRILTALSLEATLKPAGPFGVTMEALAAPALYAEEYQAQEASGRYYLARKPVVPFSEVIRFRETVLRKNEDYVIKYDEGSIVLITPILPSADDPLYIKYSYLKSVDASDVVPGDGSKGPYQLSHNNVIDGSERILINERAVLRDLDYSINYKEGKLIFNYEISNTSAIAVKYAYKEMIIPPLPPPAKYPFKLTAGVNYLRESSKKGIGAATESKIESFTSATILNNSNTIYLTKYPLTASSEGGALILSIDGIPLVSGVDYAVPTTSVDPTTGNAVVNPPTRLAYINDPKDTSDGYTTGTIKILTDIANSKEVAVSYNYNKTVTGRFTGIGNGGRGPYYMTNFRNLAPGSERVEVWETGSSDIRIYTRNNSFEANAGDEGYSINYQASNPYIMFNKELLAAKNFNIIFQYVPPSVPAGGDVSQEIIGLDVDLGLGKLLEFNGAYARSSIDQVIVSTSTSEVFTFSAATNKLVLSSKPVIENSENVFVNNKLVNRDRDYFITYTDGTVTFYYLTLTTSDRVVVDYEYQSGGGTEKDTIKKEDSAYKYGFKSQPFEALTLAFNNKEIGFGFTPMGGTAVGVGAKYKDLAIGFNPSSAINSSFSYKETNNPKGASAAADYNNSYDNSYSIGINPRNVAQINGTYRNYHVVDKTTLTSVQNSYSASLVPASWVRGQLTFNQKYDASSSINEDKVQKTKNQIDNLHYNLGLKATSRFSVGLDYSISEPVNRAENAATLTDDVTARSYTRDQAYDLNLDLTFPAVQKLTTYAKQIKHEVSTSLPQPASYVQTLNTTYHVELLPVTQIRTAYDFNRSETPSFLVSGKNPMNERTAASIGFVPFSYFTTDYAYSEDHTVNDSAQESRGLGNNYGVNWQIISWDVFKLNSKFNYNFRTDATPAGSSEVVKNVDSLVQNYTASFTPHPAFSITPGFVQENYKMDSTNNEHTKTQNITKNCSLSWAPIVWYSLSGSYSEKITSDQTLDPSVDYSKLNEGLKNTFKIFSWGDIIYDWVLEDNEGEVLGTGTLSKTHYKKITQSYSLNFNVPWDNPVLNSVLFVAAYKQVDYKNFNNATEDLSAQMMTFEGTLNF